MQVDLTKYQGIWYEIARLPNDFENNCTNSIAIYSSNDNGTMNIQNQCMINNEIVTVNGIAYPQFPTRQVGHFKVYFHNEPTPGEYNIIYIGSNYQYAMVGTTDRKKLWLLSRTPYI
jgi:apolipoprotein D and lipocalin family protein